jgi:hypothetical protein
MVHIVVVLDASGSMSSIQSDVIKSVNEFIRDQQKIKDDNCTFTFVTFSDSVNIGILKTPIENAQTLTTDNYKTTGCTALYKAITDSIKIFENEKDVLMVIVTDGQENASPTEYNRQSVFDLVTKHKNKNGWNFVYLSADLDTFSQGTNIGFGTESFSYDSNGFTNCTSGCSNTAVGYSSLAKNISGLCNTAIGDMRLASKGSNIAIGSSALSK